MIKELFDFKNKVIVVTGCSGHLGRAIVNFFIAISWGFVGVLSMILNIYMATSFF